MLNLIKDYCNKNNDYNISGFDISRIKKIIGNGSYKECYEDTSDSNKVILITREINQIYKELSYYRELNKLGIKTQKIHESYFLTKPFPVIILVVEKLYHLESREVFYNRSNLLDLLFILEYFKEINIEPIDLQIMKNINNQLIFIDPLYMEKGLTYNIILHFRKPFDCYDFQINYTDYRGYLSNLRAFEIREKLSKHLEGCYI